MGVLTESGMADAMAANMASIRYTYIPGLPYPDYLCHRRRCGLLGSPVDAYYFGILPVIVPIAAEFGISGMQITMAAFMGQAIRYGSPTVAWLFLLIDRTEMNFGDYLKTFMKYALPMFVLFIITALVLGLFPV